MGTGISNRAVSSFSLFDILTNKSFPTKTQAAIRLSRCIGLGGSWYLYGWNKSNIVKGIRGTVYQLNEKTELPMT
jgi:hypothetical protein